MKCSRNLVIWWHSYFVCAKLIFTTVDKQYDVYSASDGTVNSYNASAMYDPKLLLKWMDFTEITDIFKNIF